MRYGMTLPTMVERYERKTTLEWCRAIEDGPYASLSVGERISFRNQEQTVVLAAAAALTERPRIISTIVILPMHPAALVAKRAATLDVLCDGRLTLGLGVGGREDDYRCAEAPFARRLARLDDKVAELKRLWSAVPPFEGAEPVGPPPVQAGGPPLFSSSMGPRSMTRGARWADGHAGFTLAAEAGELKAAAETVRSAWREAGRTSPPYLMTSFWFSLGPDAVERHRRYVEAYMAIDPPAAAFMVEAATVSSPERVREAVAAVEEAGFDELMFVPTTPDVAELDRLAALL